MNYYKLSQKPRDRLINIKNLRKICRVCDNEIIREEYVNSEGEIKEYMSCECFNN